jgi:hypothetical protein
MTRYEAWVSAEAFVKLMDGFVAKLGMRKRPRAHRAVGGTDAAATSDATEAHLGRIAADDEQFLQVICGLARGNEEATGWAWAELGEHLALLESATPASELARNPLQGTTALSRFRWG